MLWLSRLITASTLLGLAGALHSEDTYGTGISLSSDYGYGSTIVSLGYISWSKDCRTVNVYSRNGSFIDVAEIEGGEAYKACMRGFRQTLSSTSITNPRYCPFSQQLCKYWPLQTINIIAQNPLAPMLKALLSAAEATLETKVYSAMVATHTIDSVDAVNTHMRSAFDEMSTTGYGRHFRVVDSLVPALRLEGVCNDTLYPSDPERYVVKQTFLGIEYTRGSLNAAMFYQECGDY
jgi:hypothetical protein